jgi:hypothetical protein
LVFGFDFYARFERAVQSPSRKRLPLVFGHHAGVAQLLDVVDLWHPTYHLLTPELPERLEVEMTKPLMAMSSLIISTSGKAEGLSHLHVKHVQPVALTVDLGEKATTAVPDPKHPSVNLHSQAALIELAEDDDGVLEDRDVVDPMEQFVLTGLGHKHHGPDVADLHRGLVTEFDGAPDATIQVGEVPNAPGHVVCGATVEVPSHELVVVGAIVEESLCVRLIDAKQGRRGERWRGVGVRGS